MRQTDSVFRKAVAAWIPALLVVLSVAVPLMERGDLGHPITLESEHAPGTCPTGHDHTICTQVGANLSIAAAATLIDQTQSDVSVSAPVPAPVFRHLTLLDGNSSRGPPLT